MIEQALAGDGYDFLETNPHLGANLMFLCMGGSHAYGTATANSDIDIRGVAFNSKSDLLGLTSFEQVVDKTTDTVIYSLRKAVDLLCASNPNILELLGARETDYKIYHPLAKTLIDNQALFLSRRAIYSFGGYANAQLRRLQNAVARDRVDESTRNKHIAGSIGNALPHLATRYAKGVGGIKISVKDGALTVNANLTDYPLRDFAGVTSEIQGIVRNYETQGKRNRRPAEKSDKALDKHAMHLVRLYLMAFDILERRQVITYRGDDLLLLNDVRNGKYREPTGTYSPEFFGLVDELDKRLAYAAAHTELPEKPDMTQVGDFLVYLNESRLKEL